MNKLFINDLIERLETICDTVKVYEQQDIINLIDEFNDVDNFPMICFETSSDNNFNVPLNESKFLTDSAYRHIWIAGTDDNAINFILCLHNVNSRLYIDAFEVNNEMRRQGIGGNVVSVIESVIEDNFYYSEIVVSPFDTDAMNFWEHMEYIEMNDCLLTKRI